jgi:hypothetical protein
MIEDEGLGGPASGYALLDSIAFVAGVPCVEEDRGARSGYETTLHPLLLLLETSDEYVALNLEDVWLD